MQGEALLVFIQDSARGGGETGRRWRCYLTAGYLAAVRHKPDAAYTWMPRTGNRIHLGQKSGCSAELVLRWLTRTRLCRHCRRPFSWRIRCSRCRVCVISLIRCLLFAPLSLSTLFPIGGFSCAHTHSRVLARTDC